MLFKYLLTNVAISMKNSTGNVANSFKYLAGGVVYVHCTQCTVHTNILVQHNNNTPSEQRLGPGCDSESNFLCCGYALNS
jgi:hypothetical protein